MTQTSWGLRAIGAAGLVWTCAGLAADTEVPKPHDPAKAQLPAVVVTATKTPTTSDRTAASLTVIDHAEIERQQFRLLPTPCALCPG
jgi:outer membrane cobalamin receptor